MSRVNQALPGLRAAPGAGREPVGVPPHPCVPRADPAAKKTSRADPALRKTARADRASTTAEAHQASTEAAADSAAKETS
ncbi:hypothetical protein ACWEBX_25540 [Streptomyces sp. NPDC005070]